MRPKRARLVVGWRQVPVTKVRVRPVRVATTPRTAVAAPTVPRPEGPPDADEEESR